MLYVISVIVIIALYFAAVWLLEAFDDKDAGVKL